MAELKLGIQGVGRTIRPRELVELGVLAEAHGMDSATVSDHFNPWRHEGGPPRSLAWTRGRQRTSRAHHPGHLGLHPDLPLQPRGDCPGLRDHGLPVPRPGLPQCGRIGSEIATGFTGEWRSSRALRARLRRSVRLMRERGGVNRSISTASTTTSRAPRSTTCPEGGVPVYIAAGGPAVAKYAPATGSSAPPARAGSADAGRAARGPRPPSGTSTPSTR